MNSILHLEILKNESTHHKVDHPRLSGFLIKIMMHTEELDIQLCVVILK